MEKIIIRNATFKDEMLVNKLCKRNGLAGESCDQAWDWIWKNNRFYNEKWPIGWILESNDVIVGYIGNIPRAYTLNGKTWIAGVARSFVVDKEYRKFSLKLISSFFRQKEADLFIFSSANNLSSSIYKIAKAESIPQENYNNDLFWIVTPFSFTLSFLRKKGLPKILSFLIAGLISPFILCEDLIRNRWKKSFNCDVEVSSPRLLTHNFEKLWHKIKVTNPNKLLSFRDRESILWQYDNCSSRNKKPVIFTLSINNELVGYMIVSRADSKEFRLRRMIIEDLIVYDNNPDSIRCLVRKAFLYAKTNKVDLLQMTGFTNVVRDALKLAKPFSRKYTYSRFWYYVVNNDLKEPLKEKSTWYASIFDGDSSI